MAEHSDEASAPKQQNYIARLTAASIPWRIILNGLGLGDLLKLRLVVGKNYEDELLPYLRPFLKTLFVTPTKLSLRNFKLIARSPFFRPHIDTVIFVPQALEMGESDWLWTDDENEEEANTVGEDSELEGGSEDGDVDENQVAVKKTLLEKYRSKARKLSSTEARLSLGLCQNLVAEHKINYESSRYADGIDEADFAEDVYRALEGGLRRLSNLQRIVITECITQDGLNASCMWYSPEYEQKRQANGLYTLRSDRIGEAAVSMLIHNMTTECVHVFFEAIKDSQIDLRDLAVGIDHEGQLYEEIQKIAWDPELLLTVFRKLDTLTISCKDSDKADFNEHHPFWTAIAECAICLKKLTFYAGTSPSGWETPGYVAAAMDHFLNFGDYPRLEYLSIKGTYTRPNMVRAKAFRAFLLEHCGTLQEVELTGVMFSDGIKDEDVCATMKSVLDEAAANLENVKSFKMKLHRRDEHFEKGCLPDGAPLDSPCREICVMYKMHYYGWMHRRELEKLAELLGVALKNGSWDFGEYVMRNKV